MASNSTRQIYKYSEEALESALKAIRNGQAINKASRQYGVPRSTLQDKLKGRVPEGPRRMGPTPYLTSAEESKIVEWCINLSKCGFPRKESDILNTVQKMILDDKRKTPFKNGRPGKKWFSLFLKRNPQLVPRTPEGISKGRAVITEEFIRKWFSDLKNYLLSINCFDLLNDQKRIFNGDETSFSMCPKTGKVLAPKGSRNVYEVNIGNEKETLTVLMIFSAAGQTIPPLVVFPYKRTPKDIVDSMPGDWFLGKSDSGWMRSDTFHDYIVNGFGKWLKDEETPKPVILFVDGHKSHLTLTLSEYCSENNIILYALPANTTHMMQPADVSVFRPLKQEWKKTVKEWLELKENSNNTITKATFCPVFNMVLDKLDMVDTIKNGFKRCGLYPFDPNAVDYTKCIQNVRENFAAVSVTISEEEIATTLSVINRLRSVLLSQGFNVNELLNTISTATNYAPPVSTNVNDEVAIFPGNSGEIEGTYNVNEDGTLEKILDEIPTYNFDDSFTIPSELDTTALFGDTTISIDLVNSPGPSLKGSSYCSPNLQKYLEIPKPIPKKDKISTPTRPPCALSSSTWRQIIFEKEEEKRLKAVEVQKRKEERSRKKMAKENTKASKGTKGKKAVKSKIKCSACYEELVSDVEDDPDKNIGCDNCTRWYHLKCTMFKDMNYENASKEYYKCNFCDSL